MPGITFINPIAKLSVDAAIGSPVFLTLSALQRESQKPA
jgi:hypothetical protein